MESLQNVRQREKDDHCIDQVGAAGAEPYSISSTSVICKCPSTRPSLSLQLGKGKKGGKRDKRDKRETKEKGKGKREKGKGKKKEGKKERLTMGIVSTQAVCELCGQ